MKNLRAFSAIIVILLLAAFMSQNAYAFNKMDARSFSMGGAHLSSARGNDVIGWNPAFLGFDDNPRFSITLPGLNFGSRWVNNFFSIDLMNTYAIEGKYLDDQDKEDILSHIDGDDIEISQDNFIPVFAASFSTPYFMFGLSVDAASVADMNISEEFLRLGLMGHSLDDFGSDRVFQNSGDGLAAGRVGLTFAKNFRPQSLDMFDELAVGATVQIYRGIAFMEMTQADGRIFTDRDTLAGEGLVDVFFTNVDANDVSGSGMGLDLGLGAKMMDSRLELGFSLQNMGASIEWNGVDHRQFEYTIDKTPSTDDFNEDDDPGNGEEDDTEFFEKILSWERTDVEEDISYTTDLPSYMNLSAGYWLTQSFLVSANLRSGLNETYGSDGSSRFGAGLEYSGLSALPLRFGFAAGGRGGFQVGAGFGLHFGWWKTDIGWAFEDGLFNSAKGFQFAINTTFQFGTPDKGEASERKKAPKFKTEKQDSKKPKSDKRSRVKPPNRKRRR